MGFRLTLIVFFLIFFYNKISLAQEPQIIRVKKELNLKKVVFDNSEFRLMVIDRFGNPRENKIASYQLDIKIPNETKIFFGFGNNLSQEMLNYLYKLDKAANMFFIKIMVYDEDEHLINLPDFKEEWVPALKKSKKIKSK